MTVNILFNPFKDPKEAENLLLKQGKSLQRINYIEVSELKVKVGNEKNEKWINDAMIQKYLISHKLVEATEQEKLESLHINYEKIIFMKGI